VAGERILLVEDTDELRQYLATRVLRPAGYEVFTAQDGAEGFTLARQIEPHVIVSGYEMPRVNGLSMLEALQSAGLYIPFILMTAEGSEALAVRALRMGVYDYLVKPFSGEELLLALQRTQRRFRTRQIAEDIPEQLLQVNRHLEQRLRELDTLVSLGKRVTAQLERQQVLHQIVEAAVEITGAELGKALLRHPVELLPGVREAVGSVARDWPVVLITKGDLFHQEAKVRDSGLSDLFRRIEIVSEKDAGTYARLFAEFGVAPSQFAMVGNSLRSDIAPVLELGGWGVHVPYHLTWAHEAEAEVRTGGERMRSIEGLDRLPLAMRELTALARS